jgi:hypothetical protein
MYSVPTDADIDRLARMWVSVGNLVREEYGVDASTAPEFLGWVQALLDDDVVDRSEYASECIGCALGRVMADNIDGLDWCAYEDDLGRDLCLRYRDTSLVVFPMEMVAKRRENDDAVDLSDLLRATAADIDRLSNDVGRVS